MMGVATSAGQMAQARMPLTHSSMLIVSVIAMTACLLALYAAPVSAAWYTPAQEEMLMTSPSCCARIDGSTAKVV